MHSAHLSAVILNICAKPIHIRLGLGTCDSNCNDPKFNHLQLRQKSKFLQIKFKYATLAIMYVALDSITLVLCKTRSHHILNQNDLVTLPSK